MFSLKAFIPFLMHVRKIFIALSNAEYGREKVPNAKFSLNSVCMQQFANLIEIHMLSLWCYTLLKQELLCIINFLHDASVVSTCYIRYQFSFWESLIMFLNVFFFFFL